MPKHSGENDSSFAMKQQVMLIQTSRCFFKTSRYIFLMLPEPCLLCLEISVKSLFLHTLTPQSLFLLLFEFADNTLHHSRLCDISASQNRKFARPVYPGLHFCSVAGVRMTECKLLTF